MDIYIDVLVVINAYICWLLLSAASYITHTFISATRKLLSSLIGGFSALILLVQSENTLHVILIHTLKLITFIAVVYICFYKQRIRKIIVSALVYFGLNVLLGGAVEAMNRIFGNSAIYVNNGVLYFDISLTDLILTTASIYVLLVISSRLYARCSSKNHSYRVEFSIKGNSYSLMAIADTGNHARDIFSGKPVIVCTGIDLYNNSESIRTIPVPYNTISGEGILYALRPDRICVTDETNTRVEVDVLVAGIESKCGECRAIFNPDIL